MEDHIYEDPDASLPMNVPAIPAVIFRDYRENFAGSSGRKGGAQQLSKESTSKSLKNLKGMLKGKINQESKNSAKSKKEKCVSGDNQVSGFKKSHSEKRLKNKIANLSEQNPRKSRSRGHPDSDIHPPAFSASMATGVKDAIHDISDEDSPPPVLPSRGYLLDEEFSIELKAIEKQIAGIQSDTESDEDSDGYTSMDNTTCCDDFPGPLHTQTNKDVLPEQKNRPPKPLSTERSYENFTNTNRQPIQDAAVHEQLYKNFDNAYPVPERQYYNFEDAKRHLACLLPETDHLPPRQIGDTESLEAEEDEDNRLYENFGNEETSEQEVPPQIPARPHNNDAHTVDETRTRPKQEQVPSVPKRPGKKGGLAHGELGSQPRVPPRSSTAAQGDMTQTPGRPRENNKRGALIHKIPEAERQLDLPPRHRDNYRNSTMEDSIVDEEGLHVSPDKPTIPARSYKDDVRGHLNSLLKVPEGQYANFADAEIQPESTHMPPIPPRCYENFTDAQDPSQEEESGSYKARQAPERNDGSEPDDEDGYINHDDTPGYVNSGDVVENGQDGENENFTYDYVHADTIRSIRGRAGRWAGK